MAVGLPAVFGRLTLEQRRLDRLVRYGAPAFDHEKAEAEADEAERQRLEERRREDEEIRGRTAGARLLAEAPA
jgi:hypothetical protein